MVVGQRQLNSPRCISLPTGLTDVIRRGIFDDVVWRLILPGCTAGASACRKRNVPAALTS